MRLETERILIRRPEQHDVEELLDLRVRNREFVKPFEPLVPEAHFTVEGQREIIAKIHNNWALGIGFGFGVFLKQDGRLVGRVNLSNVVRGAWESCTLGYFIDQEMNGQGVATEAVRLAVQYAFGPAGLHRVQAAVMPRNAGSIRVLEKAGFQYDGFSEYYLKINGVWEHHNLYSVTQERWRGQHG